MAACQRRRALSATGIDMASTPLKNCDDGAETLDEMINGNYTDQDSGRDKYVVATMIGDRDEGKDTSSDKDTGNDKVVKPVKGVRISSNGEQEEGAAKYTVIEVPSDDEMFQLKPTDISTAMGLELLVKKTAHCEDLISDPEGNLNRTGAYLNIPVNPEEEDFGFFSVVFNDMSVGPVNVVRQDKKDITPKQVEALAVFGRFHIDEEYRLLTRVVYGPDEEEIILLARRAFVEHKLSRPAFESFFETFKRGRADGDPSWADVISPYEG
jgi:hypothetical protein